MAFLLLLSTQSSNTTLVLINTGRIEPIRSFDKMRYAHPKCAAPQSVCVLLPHGNPSTYPKQMPHDEPLLSIAVLLAEQRSYSEFTGLVRVTKPMIPAVSTPAF